MPTPITWVRLGRSCRTSDAMITVATTWAWSTSDASPAGIPTARPV